MDVRTTFPRGRRVIVDRRPLDIMGTVLYSTSRGVGVTLDNGGQAYFSTGSTAAYRLDDLAPLCVACEKRPCSFDTEPPDAGYFSGCDNPECRKARAQEAVNKRKAANK